MDNPVCFNNHMGPWLVEPSWFTNTVQAVKDGLYDSYASKPKAQSGDSTELDRLGVEVSKEGIAVIPVVGPMMKGFSKFMDNASTVRIRQQVRAAVRDEDVKGILLQIDSPGGQVAGTKELADDIASATSSKPVFAQIEDLGASAALWIAVQADKVFANLTAEVGSIGVFAVVEDTSEAADRAGVKVHVISTGDQKGAFVDGAPVTKEQLAELQGRVDDINVIFKTAVSEGRGLTMAQVDKVADGRTFIAEKAEELGLIDGVASTDETMAALTELVKGKDRQNRQSTLFNQMDSPDIADQ